MKIANEWLDYELLLTKDGMKKEKWGEYTLVRPPHILPIIYQTSVLSVLSIIYQTSVLSVLSIIY